MGKKKGPLFRTSWESRRNGRVHPAPGRQSGKFQPRSHGFAETTSLERHRTLGSVVAGKSGDERSPGPESVLASGDRGTPSAALRTPRNPTNHHIDRWDRWPNANPF